MSFFKSFLRSRVGRWILAIGAILLLVLLIRGCSSRVALHQEIYHIARLVNWYPIQLSGKEANLQAFIDELISAIGLDEKLAIDMDTFQSGDLFTKLDSEEYDAILVTITVTPFLQERYAVSNSIFLAGPVLVVPLNSSISSLGDLSGRPIGVSKESSLIFRLATQYPDLQLVTYDNAITALNELVGRSVFGVIMEAQLAYTYTQVLYPDKLKVATPQLIDLGIRLIAHKDERGEHLVDHFNQGLAKVHASGDYELLLKRWELVSPQ